MKNLNVQRVVAFILLLFSISTLNAQGATILGPSTGTVNQTYLYTRQLSSGTTAFGGLWSVSSGATIISQTTSSASIKFTSTGTKTITFSALGSNFGTVQATKNVVVSSGSSAPARPGNPTVTNQTCTSATLVKSGNPPSGVSWYWQGTSSSGTSTSNNATSNYNISASGTYYIRARATSGTWSTSSGLVHVTLGSIGGSTWYADTDNDGLGDPATSQTSCNQPMGYVSNNNDLCPNENGPSSNNGCPNSNGLSNENYVHTITPQIEVSDLSGLTNDDHSIKSVGYFDGLGRPVQTVAIQASDNSKDVVTHIGYDNFGRKSKDYLPIEVLSNDGKKVSNAETLTSNFYATTKYQNTQNPYSEKEIENSPLSRIVKQAAPGSAWEMGSGHEMEFEYKANAANEVRLYTVSLDANNAPSLLGGSSYYLADKLQKNITKDENHPGTSSKLHTTEEFKDKQGMVVLKRTYALVSNSETAHDTYYVYDDYGNLTYVLPPKVLTSDGVSTTELNELAYQYRYDKKNRLIEKKIPGKGLEEIVYNKLDKVVLTRDANLKTQKKWLFTKYDKFGRVVYTGFKNVSNSDTFGRTYFQNLIDTHATATQFETKVTSGTGYLSTYYTSTAIPTGVNEIHTINYFDNYYFNLGGSALPQNLPVVYNEALITNAKGLATGSKVKILGTSLWTTSLNYYDNKARPIYAYSFNDYLNTTDIVKTKLDFTGKVLETTATHTNTNNSQATMSIVDVFDYDHMGRLVQQKQAINGASTYEIIAQNTYDELGQLVIKKVGGKSNQSRLQTVNYNYNVRGWLTGINNTNSSNASISLGTGDLFGFQINYDNPTDTSKKLYNGNISQTLWKTTSTNPTGNLIANKYTYSYDALNRITNAADNTGRYDLYNLTYDKNGNIKSLKRDGKTHATNNTFGLMDNLTYTYHDGEVSNRLKKVEDASGSIQGFKNGSNVTEEYTYDSNGNLLSDANKGITSILYNHLSLPTEVKFNNSNTQKINYTYDATGVKLKKVTNDNGNVTTTDYASGYVYKNNILQHFPHTEGYVEPDGNGFQYVYSYVDHLGNVRLNYSDLDNNGSINPSTEILQERNTYPFGLEHKGYNNVIVGTENNHKTYQGQELNEDLGYNMHEYKWRHYDASIGRFNVIDPLATDFPQWAPYVFSGNYVTISKELEGLEPEFMINGANGLKSDNRLTTPMVSLLSAAFGYSPESLQGTTYHRDSDPRSHWFGQKVLKYNSSVIAITVGSQVINRSDLSDRSSRFWFSHIAHEQQHRSDIDTYGGGLFYLSYGLESIRALGVHDNLGHEKSANSNEAYAKQLWDYNGGEVRNILGSNRGGTLAGQAKLLESVGARFRRDVILDDTISGAESLIGTTQGILKDLGNSKEDQGIRAALGNMISAWQQNIKDAKKEQDDITKKYGN